MIAIKDVPVIESNRIDLLKTLPFGQRMIRVGFKPVCYDGLMDRLGCTATNKQNEERAKRKARYIAFLANKRQEEKRLKSFFKKKKKPYKVIKFYDYDDEKHYWVVCKERCFVGGECCPIDTPPQTIKGKTANYLYWDEWEVDFKILDDYCDGKIPLRCIKSIQKAKTLGVEYFWVAYSTEKMPDPIIIATKEKDKCETPTPKPPYYEIDMWE